MKGKTIKRILACLVFCALVVLLVVWLNDLLVVKTTNRYYMRDRHMETLAGEEYDVQVYGSCHAYSSFNPMILEEEYGVSAYNMAAAGEIIPTTYLWMRERFRYDAPEVALVEIWGVNVYETYIPTEEILGDYQLPNLSQVPISREKIEVIRRFDCFDMLGENFPIAKYKDRLLDGSLNEADFNYSLETVAENVVSNRAYMGEIMADRFELNGFLAYGVAPLSSYRVQQGDANGESLAVEEDMMIYVEKIIALCEEYDVELIFYRAPYRSTDNELKKVNYLHDWFGERGIPFYDLEEEIRFNTLMDFHDYEHLCECGAEKATRWLIERILPLLPEKV